MNRSLAFALAFALLCPEVVTAAPGAAGAVFHNSGQTVPAGTMAVGRHRLPLRFERQAGQLDARWSFRARALGYTALFDRAGLVLRRPGDAQGIRLSVAGSPEQTPRGLDRLPGTSNYISPVKTVTDVESYARVRYEQVAAGIAQEFYATETGEIEYDFLCQPGSTPEQLRMDIRAAARAGSRLPVRIETSTGELVIETRAGQMRLRAPRAFQQDGTEVTVDYLLDADGTVGFRLGSYDRTQPLRIDPVVSLNLNYASYLGGYDLDQPLATAFDAQGSQYVAGYTESSNFPVTSGAFYTDGSDVAFNRPSAFVVKMNPQGTALVYSTFIHGAQRNNISNAGSRAHAIAIGPDGSAYITGTTTAVDYPTTPDAFLRARAGAAAFLTRLNPAGTGLLYSTLIGGQNTTGYSIALDAQGQVFVGGRTDASFFPSGDATSSPARATQIGAGSRNNSQIYDGFVVRFSPQGVLTGSACIGGAVEDSIRALAVGADGSVHATGRTQSTDFPITPGSFAPAFRSDSAATGDGFLVRLDAALGQELYGTFIGGRRDDEGRGLAVAGDGTVWVAGVANSTDMPTTPGSIKPARSDDVSYSDGWLVRLDISQPGGAALRYGTFIGGDRAYDGVASLALDAAGDVWVAGKAGNPSGVPSDVPFPTTGGAYQEAARNDDGFMIKVAGVPAAQPGALLYASRIGGSGLDEAVGIATASGGAVALAGQTVSPDLTTTQGAFQPALSRNPARSQTDIRQDGFVARFSDPTAGSGSAMATISGRVSAPAGSGIAGATVRLSGGSSGTQQTSADGRYAFIALLTRVSYTVSVELAGYTFSPPQASTSSLSGDAQFDFTGTPTGPASPLPPSVRRAPRPRGTSDASIAPGSLIAYTFSAAQPAEGTWDGQPAGAVGADGVIHAPAVLAGYGLTAGGVSCEIHAVHNLGTDPQNGSFTRLEIVAFVPETVPAETSIQLVPQLLGTNTDQALSVQSSRAAPAFWDDAASSRSFAVHAITLIDFTAGGIDTGYRPLAGAVSGGVLISIFATGVRGAPNTQAANDPAGLVNVAESFRAEIVRAGSRVPVEITYAGRVRTGPGGIDQMTVIVPGSLAGAGTAELQLTDADGTVVARIDVR